VFQITVKFWKTALCLKVQVLLQPRADASVETTFVFEEPVYLEGGKEYAICITSNAKSTAYQVYTSKLGDFVLGSTTERIQRDPFSGVFFKSSNW
jgi:hypothetical protein